MSGEKQGPEAQCPPKELGISPALALTPERNPNPCGDPSVGPANTQSILALLLASCVSPGQVIYLSELYLPHL